MNADATPQPVDAPRGVQLSRKRGARLPANTIIVARRPGSPWGNPYPAQCARNASQDQKRVERARVTQLFREYIYRPEQAALRARARQEMRGMNPACWCPLDGECHRDVWLEVANSPDEPPILS